ncbi:B12-binding domain-containing radical SAM protein [Clostridium sp. DJ247]|uniref:B12-binding domain-containing radical SAM protein n=1 Tax=Clostridium sp. DJ247 TaxID=2726188 RepID=UPI001627C411|nr:B12-binding domain-containing radical SAM protein [Clostridium sp. DJ247]MBC2580100.1 B12-binding domain-containing radical SAM protein [Clostridium sp. DJ247]
MKVALVAVNSKFIHSNLAVKYLKAYTKNLDYHCMIMEFSINDSIQRVVEEIISEKPNIIVFSCYIWNMYYVKQLTDLIKLIDGDVRILYGGPEVSYDSEEILKDSKNKVDYIIEGEGEESYKEFIECVISNRSLEGVKGLYYKENNGIIYGGKRKLMDLNKLVFPYSEEDDLNNKIIYFESSRGCPFKCKYCLSSSTQGVRFLDVERVKRDLKFFVDKKVKLVKFVDRTFNCNSDFAIKIWTYLMSLDTETTFHFEVSADILNEEQLKILKKAPKGRFQFEVGVQTTNDEVLKNINRFVPFKDIKEQFIKLNKYGNIKQHLDLIAGLPGEDFESFKKSFNDLYSIQPDEIQLGFLKVLKGTLMKEEAEKWGIIHSPYTPNEVLKTNDISYEELVLLKRVEKMVDKYYNSQKFNTIIKYFISKFETAFDFYLALGNFFHSKGYFARSLSPTDYYKVFLEFNNEIMHEQNENLKEIVKFDYLKFNKKRWLPDFLARESDKILEKNLRDAQKNNVVHIPYEKYHLERFKVDILNFLSSGVISKENCYLIFDENVADNILDITATINKEKL